MGRSKRRAMSASEHRRRAQKYRDLADVTSDYGTKEELERAAAKHDGYALAIESEEDKGRVA